MKFDGQSPLECASYKINHRYDFSQPAISFRRTNALRLFADEQKEASSCRKSSTFLRHYHHAGEHIFAFRSPAMRKLIWRHSKIRTSACGNPSAGRKCEREGESESLRINSFDRNNQVDFHYQVPLSCLAHLPSHRCCRTIIVNLLGLRRVACCSFPAGMRACVGIFFCTPSLLGSPPVACFPSSPEQFRHADTWMARVT